MKASSKLESKKKTCLGRNPNRKFHFTVTRDWPKTWIFRHLHCFWSVCRWRAGGTFARFMNWGGDMHVKWITCAGNPSSKTIDCGEQVAWNWCYKRFDEEKLLIAWCLEQHLLNTKSVGEFIDLRRSISLFFFLFVKKRPYKLRGGQLKMVCKCPKICNLQKHSDRIGVFDEVLVG